MGDIGRETEFHLLCETLKHRYAHSVSQAPIRRRLIGAANPKVRILEECAVLISVLINEPVLVSLKVKGVDETGHRHIGLAHDSVGYGVALIFIVTHFVAIVQKHLCPHKPGMCVAQIHWNLFVVHTGVSGRSGDVAVVGDSSVLLVQQIVV